MKHSERNARSDGYLDGLEGRASRAMHYSPASYANAYVAGFSDGQASRERQRNKVRGLAIELFRGSTEQEAGNPDFVDRIPPTP